MDDRREARELHLAVYVVLLVRQTKVLDHHVFKFYIEFFSHSTNSSRGTGDRLTTWVRIALARCASGAQDRVPVLVDDGDCVLFHAWPAEPVAAGHNTRDKVFLKTIKADPAIEELRLDRLERKALALELAALAVEIVLELRRNGVKSDKTRRLLSMLVLVGLG